MKRLKTRLPALVMAGGLALVGAACETDDTTTDDPAVQDPATEDPLTPPDASPTATPAP